VCVCVCVCVFLDRGMDAAYFTTVRYRIYIYIYIYIYIDTLSSITKTLCSPDVGFTLEISSRYSVQLESKCPILSLV
jgi:hypothetical protein